VVYEDNLQNTVSHHKVDMAFVCIVQQHFYLWCKDHKKDFYLRGVVN